MVLKELNNLQERLCLPKGGKRMKTADLCVSSSLCYGNRLASGTSRLWARVYPSYPLPEVWTVGGLVRGISIRDFSVFLSKLGYAFMIFLLNIGD